MIPMEFASVADASPWVDFTAYDVQVITGESPRVVLVFPPDNAHSHSVLHLTITFQDTEDVVFIHETSLLNPEGSQRQWELVERRGDTVLRRSCVNDRVHKLIVYEGETRIEMQSIRGAGFLQMLREGIVAIPRTPRRGA